MLFLCIEKIKERMQTDSGNIFVWDVDYIARFTVFHPWENVYEEARRFSLHEKWNELTKFYNSHYKSTKVKSRTEFQSICDRKGYKYINGKEPSLLSVNINGTKYDLEFSFACKEVKMRPSIKNISPASKFKTQPEMLIQQMERFSKLVKTLQEVLKDAIHQGKILETTTKIAYPYILNKIESSGYLNGIRHDIIEQGCGILLRIKDPIGKDGEWYEGEVNMDNLDIILEKLPIALSDPENFEFYFSAFGYCWDHESIFK